MRHGGFRKWKTHSRSQIEHATTAASKLMEEEEEEVEEKEMKEGEREAATHHHTAARFMGENTYSKSSGSSKQAAGSKAEARKLKGNHVLYRVNLASPESCSPKVQIRQVI